MIIGLAILNDWINPYCFNKYVTRTRFLIARLIRYKIIYSNALELFNALNFKLSNFLNLKLLSHQLIFGKVDNMSMQKFL